MADNQDLLTPNHEKCCSETQLIYGDGTFNVEGIENFKKEVNLVNCGLPYGTVSIIGPQSSGKSTLNNCMFGTKFEVMDDTKPRSKTTQGVWIARSEEGKGPFTLVLDVEGTDGRERGEDDTFEKLSALFVLAMSNVVIINMWYKDIGCHNAANRPLLRTIFQERKNLESVPGRKITLLFVIRDAPMNKMKAFDTTKEQVKKDAENIWGSVYATNPLSEKFNVDVVGLPYYEHEEEFMKGVANLRQRISDSFSPDGLAGDNLMSSTSQQNWKVISEKDHLKKLSREDELSKLCEKIAGTFEAKEEWRHLKQSVEKNGAVPEFVNKLNSLILDCLSEYDKQSEGNAGTVTRSNWRNRLEYDLYKHFKSAFIYALEGIRFIALDEFKKLLDKAIKDEKKLIAAAEMSNIPVVLEEVAKKSFNSCLSYFENECGVVEFEQAKMDKNLVMLKLASDIRKHIEVKNEDMLKKREHREFAMKVLEIFGIGAGSLCFFCAAGALVVLNPTFLIHFAVHGAVHFCVGHGAVQGVIQGAVIGAVML